MLSAVVGKVQEQFSRKKPRKYVLGLAIDFVSLAQKISRSDPELGAFRPGLTEAELFSRYHAGTAEDDEQGNTLTFRFEGQSFGIRAVEEAVCDLFIKADRTGYPSAYVYNTGMWHHFKPMLLDCFKLSEGGRFSLISDLIEFGLASFPKNIYFGRAVPRVRLFESIVADYPRSARGENSGMVFQGIVYGFLKADRPHLSLIVDKVRTGSARQRRFGDIDGYYGLDLELSAEVKDEDVTAGRVESELGQFLRDVTNHRVQGIAFVRSIDEAARELLMVKGLATLTDGELRSTVENWDWPKQNSAVHGLLHFVAHVEQNPKARPAFVAVHPRQG